MSSKKSSLSSSVFSVSSCLNEETEVYTIYNGEQFYHEIVPNFIQLCEQIEENLEGVQAQDLKITYQMADGTVITVKNQSSFSNACKKWKPVLKLTLTIVAQKATSPSTNQQVNQGHKATKSSLSSSPTVSNLNHQVLQPVGTVDNSQQVINPTESHTIQLDVETQPVPTQVIPQPINTMQFYPFNPGMQPELNIHNNVNVLGQNPQSYPSLKVKAQDAARCRCGEYLMVSLPKCDTCPNQGCLLQINQTVTQLWSCSNGYDSCGKYCWICVQQLLNGCKELIFENPIQLNQINTVRQKQFYFRPVYNTHYEPTPDPKEPNPEDKKVNPKTTDSDKKLKESENQKNFWLDSMSDPKYQNDKISLERQEKQTQSNLVNQSINKDNLQSLKESKPAINQMAEAQFQLQSESYISSEKKILGLDENDLDKLKSEVDEYFEEHQTVDDEFIDHQCRQFNLMGRRSELLKFCNKFSPRWPVLTKIQTYQTKKKIIDFIVNNEKTPQSSYKLTKQFEGLTSDQLSKFKECHKKFEAISFAEDDLLEEERKLVQQLLIEKMSIDEINKTTLIHSNLIKKLYDLNEINLKQETENLEQSSDHDLRKISQEIVEPNIKDNDELVNQQILIQEEKKNEDLDITHIIQKQREPAIIFESSQEEEPSKTLIKINLDEKDFLKPPETSNSSVQVIPGLDQKSMEKLQYTVLKHIEEEQKIEEDFIEFICRKYNLFDRKSEVQVFCENLISKKEEKLVLPKIQAYSTKKKIINFIINNESLPSEYKMEKEFECLTHEELKEFKDCCQKFKAISFIEDDLFEEEKQLVFQLQTEKKSSQEISKATLIHVELVKKFYDLKVDNLKLETEIFEIICKYSRKTNQEAIQLIINDDDELVKVLLTIYKENKEEYFKITQKLTEKNYAIDFKQGKLQKLIKLASLPNLHQSTEKQKEVLLLLDHFLNSDLVVYLMVLHDFTDFYQNVEKKNLEMIILNQKHKDFCRAVVQLLILKMDPDKKKEVIQTREFIDSREDQKLKELQAQIDNYLHQQILRQDIENQLDQEQTQHDDQDKNYYTLEINENEELVNMIEAVCNIFSLNIQIYPKGELNFSMEYKPQGQIGQDTLCLVRDDFNKVFQVIIQYVNEKKILSWDGLQNLKKKYSFISERIPAWLDTFIKFSSLRMFLDDLKIDPKKILENFAETHKEYLQNRDEASKKKLYDAVIKLNLDSQLMQEWFNHQQLDKQMADFCRFMRNKGTRQKPHWAITQAKSIQQYFPVSYNKKTLKDFNCVQTYQDPDDRKNYIEKIKFQPEELAQFIINTLFSFILRKDDMQLIQSDLEKIIQDQSISLRFLVSYLLQSADMGLRARLNYYLCQNKSVPLIMSCQNRFMEDLTLVNYNQELVFSMSNVEGVGVFAFGVGKNAIESCGKSEISNLIVTPQFDNKSFDVQDLNVFSNGQIDVFLEKCYIEKSGWAFMDGQGKISEQSLISVLPLTNIVLIHFMQKDQNDEKSVTELSETINLIKESDSNIQICLILRDCNQTKEVNKSEYPIWLPCRQKVDKLIELINIQNENRLLQKSTLIEKIMLYFNEKVREIKSQNNSKFTKENFLNGFCKRDIFGKQTFERIVEILQLSQEFITEVQKSKDNVFDQQGLPSLKIKDEIREIQLALNSFEYQNDEEQKVAVQRQENLEKQKQEKQDQLSILEVNSVMEKIWEIVNHKDAVQIKIEVSKSLKQFTENNIKPIIEQKKIYTTQANQDGGFKTNEQIQEANDKQKQKMREFDYEIFKRTQSLEHHQRNLNCVMHNSKNCNYWSLQQNQKKFTNAVKQQVFDGDTFELIDGRNLEMKADIIREIVGNEIDQTKCIVICVIGPQSSGKSTLMNFCFGTQFMASAGRCTQGIYFTLQKIPAEMTNGSDVEYLIILDTEGLNSPERAASDRPDSEYDRKIVLFTLLCSDFLIINSSGDMTQQMIELISICAVRYNDLRGSTKAPKILYTFVKNNENDPAKFQAQISDLKYNVIKSSDEPTIKKTADELMEVSEDSVKVLGNAYDQKVIEKDSAKGILQQATINACAPLFGVHASHIWQQVQKFIQSGQHEFRQIGKWLLEAEGHWKLIDTHGTNIAQFGSITQMKNDKKIKQFMNQIWQQYISTQVVAKDTKKAEEKCQILYEKFRDGEDIEPYKKKFIQENQQEKDKDFKNFIQEKYFRWTKEVNQRSITVVAEEEYLKANRIKMDSLKEEYQMLIEKKFQELKLTQIHTSGIFDLYRRARNLSLEIKKIPEADQNLQIQLQFQEGWQKLEAEISRETQIEQQCKTCAANLYNTFKSVNNLLVDILPIQLKDFLLASKKSDNHPQSDLPTGLVQYLVDHISQNAFKEQNNNLDTLGQFRFVESQLAMLKDPNQRIFGQSQDAVQEKYLPLQRMFKIVYTYSIITEFDVALLKSNIFEEMFDILKQKKLIYEERKYKNATGSYIKVIYGETDDIGKIVSDFEQLFFQLGQAGFCIIKDNQNNLHSQREALLCLSNLNVLQYLSDWKLWDNPQMKKNFCQQLKKQICWQKQHFQYITNRVAHILGNQNVVISNQLNTNISLEEHKEINSQLKKAKYVFPGPSLSYQFSEDDFDGKINVKEFLKLRNLDSQMNNFFSCLITPKDYVLSHRTKWIQLSQLANAVVDWRQIVLDIEKSLDTQLDFKQKDVQSKDQKEIMKFNLQNVLERSHINIEHAEIIQSTCLQPIRTKLHEEVWQKLSLEVPQKLIGVITWVACVIIWYKLMKNVLNIFNSEKKKKQKLRKVKYSKSFNQLQKVKSKQPLHNSQNKFLVKHSKNLIKCVRKCLIQRCMITLQPLRSMKNSQQKMFTNNWTRTFQAQQNKTNTKSAQIIQQSL